jgi:hypothetical protein
MTEAYDGREVVGMTSSSMQATVPRNGDAGSVNRAGESGGSTS